MESLSELTQAIVGGNRAQAIEGTGQVIESGAEPVAVLDALIAGMEEIGRRWKANEIFVPEVLVAARAMKESMEVLEPHLSEGDVQPVATAVIGTVKGDLHDIGKNLVAMMWKGANIKVLDIGTNAPPEAFIKAAIENNADVIGLSALLTTTMPAMKSTVEAIRNAGLKDVKIIVGGAPVTESFADEIGADRYAVDAVSAVDHLREVVGVAS
ncbi:cobalamin B12-binding domain-containing protein [Poriferisphaera sp. WC338]|uniref:cobalamin B12-binding domain-containing protein n=1 Tax=Poriferisphaera sp. WC338 TaxID=3425129 RepID=UPI003D81A2A5